MKKIILFSIIGLFVLGAVIGGQVILKDVPLGKDVKAARSDWDGARIYLYGGNNYKYSSAGIISFSAMEEPVIEINAYNTVGQAEVNIYRSSVDNLLNYLIHDEDNNQLKSQIDVDISKLELVATMEHKVENNSKLTLPNDLQGIFYVSLKMKEGDMKSDIFVVRSNTGVVVKEAEKDFVFWAQDFKTKRSSGYGQLRVYDLLNKK